MVDAPAWAPRLTVPLVLVGLGVSGYLTWEHYTTGSTLSCPDTGIVSCIKVTTGPQSMIVGVPVALLGMIFFLVMLALCVPPAWRSPHQSVAWLRLGAAASGIVAVLYLVAVELLVIRAICLWCTGVHVVTFALFVAVLAAFVSPQPPPSQSKIGPRSRVRLSS